MLGLEVLSLPVRDAADFKPALQGAVQAGADALLGLTDRLVTFHRETIVGLSNEYGLPGMYG